VRVTVSAKIMCFKGVKQGFMFIDFYQNKIDVKGERNKNRTIHIHHDFEFI